MPSATINRIASDVGIKPDKVEKSWVKHKKDLLDQGFSTHDQDFWPMLVSRVKKDVGAEITKKMGWKEKSEGLSRAKSLILATVIDDLEEDSVKSVSFDGQNRSN